LPPESDPAAESRTTASLPVVRREPGLPSRLTPQGDAGPARPPRTASRRARFRGRKRYLALALLAGGTTGGLLGYLGTTPVYRAATRIEVRPITYVRPAEAAEATPATDASAAADWRLRVMRDGVARQLDVLTSAELARAVDVDAGGDGAAPAGASAKRFAAAAIPGSLGRIEVAAVDADPSRAAAALERLIAAYRDSDLFGAQTQAAVQALGHWSAREVALEKWAGYQAQLDELAASDSQEALSARRRDTAGRIARLEQRIGAIDEALASLGASGDEPADARLAALRRQREALTAALDTPGAEGGLAAGDAIGRFTTLAHLALLDRRIEALEAEQPRAAVTLPGDEGPSAPMTAAQLRAQRAELASLVPPQRTLLGSLDERLARWRELAAQAEAHRRQAEHHAGTLARLGAQPPLVVAIANQPVRVPTTPHEDRRMEHAAIGAGAGGVALFVVVLMGVWRDDRLRRPDEPALAASAAPMLGALPQLPDAGLSRDDAEHAAVSVQQLRARLESLGETQGLRAFAVMGAAPDAGKTSVAVGLAAALATAGHRVLLVDGDLADRASPGGAEARGVESVLQSMGHLPTQTAELMLGDGAGVGLLGALRGAALRRCVVETHLPGLDALPAAGAGPDHAALLSGKAIGGLLGRAREAYDYVVIDAGDLRAGVGALLFAARADGVAMVVTPAQRQREYDRALAQLRVVGARVVGTVFNRADARDAPPRPRADRRGDGAAWRPRPYASGSGIFAAAVEAQAPRVKPVREPVRQTEDPPAASAAPAPKAESKHGQQPGPAPAARALGHDAAPIPTPDTQAHRVLSRTLDRMIQSTIELNMRQRRQRAADARAGAAAATPPPPPSAEPDAPRAPEPPAEPDPAADLSDADTLDRNLDQLIASVQNPPPPQDD